MFRAEEKKKEDEWFSLTRLFPSFIFVLDNFSPTWRSERCKSSWHSIWYVHDGARSQFPLFATSVRSSNLFYSPRRSARENSLFFETPGFKINSKVATLIRLLWLLAKSLNVLICTRSNHIMHALRVSIFSVFPTIALFIFFLNVYLGWCIRGVKNNNILILKSTC